MPRHTAEQRELIECAVLDDNHTIAEAIELAASGDFCAPFAVSEAVAKRIVDEERDRRRPLAAIVDDLARRSLTLCDRELTRLERTSGLDAEDAGAFAGLAATLRQTRALIAHADG